MMDQLWRLAPRQAKTGDDRTTSARTLEDWAQTTMAERGE
jgi:hypothetical protein